MLIIQAKTLSHPKIEIITDEKKRYIIDFNSKILLNDEEFDRIRNDKDFFYNNFEWDKWNVWWSPTEDVSIGELEYKSDGKIYDINN